MRRPWEDQPLRRGPRRPGTAGHALRLLAETVRPGPGIPAPDIGCGPGADAAALAGPGCRTLAVDRADAAVAATPDRYTDLEPCLPDAGWDSLTPPGRDAAGALLDVTTVTGRWSRGHWYDLAPGGPRCFMLRT